MIRSKKWVCRREKRQENLSKEKLNEGEGGKGTGKRGKYSRIGKSHWTNGGEKRMKLIKRRKIRREMG
jgi:hypothetical protein